MESRMDVVCLVDLTGWKSKGNLELEGQSYHSHTRQSFFNVHINNQ